jgi:hypothetical protein
LKQDSGRGYSFQGFSTPRRKKIGSEDNIFSMSHYERQIDLQSKLFESSASDLNKKVEKLTKRINKTEKSLRKTKYTSQLMRILMLDLLDLA